jgi:mono/diheme cytochrome c family protein
MLPRSPFVRAGLAAVIVLGLMQLVPYRVTDPSLRSQPPWDSPQTRSLFVRACADCHSNRTRSEWYEHVAPVSWWIKGHVDGGRSALNVDEWPNVGEGGGEAAETIRERSMPPSYYTWFGLHGAAKLTPAERDELVRGLRATLKR